MKSMFPIIITLVVIVVFREDHPSPVPASGAPGIISSRDSVTGVTHTYTYDSKGRLTSEDNDRVPIPSGGPDAFIPRYTYSDTAVTEKLYYKNNGSLYETNIYQLNAQGLAISMVPQSGLKDELYSYEYNAGGYITKLGFFSRPQGMLYARRYYYTNDVLDSMNWTQPGGNIVKEYYQYYTNRNNTLDNPGFGKGFLGRKNKFPLKRTISICGHPADTLTTYYTYTYDVNQNIIRKADNYGVTIYSYR